jgi:hypothetical protein
MLKHNLLWDIAANAAFTQPVWIESFSLVAFTRCRYNEITYQFCEMAE